MKICITSTKDDLDSQVDPRFGRCNYFIIYDTENDSYECFPNPNISSFSGAGIASAQFVIDKGVDVVLTGNVGPNAFGVFQQAGIKVIIGLAGIRVREAIEKFKKGELTPSGSPNVSGHFGMMGNNFGMMGATPAGGTPFGGFGFMPQGPGRGAGGGMGRGMGRGRFYQQNPPGSFASSSMSKEEELKVLKQQLDFLRQQIEMINKRIEELEE